MPHPCPTAVVPCSGYVGCGRVHLSGAPGAAQPLPAGPGPGVLPPPGVPQARHPRARGPRRQVGPCLRLEGCWRLPLLSRGAAWPASCVLFAHPPVPDRARRLTCPGPRCPSSPCPQRLQRAGLPRPAVHVAAVSQRDLLRRAACWSAGCNCALRRSAHAHSGGMRWAGRRRRRRPLGGAGRAQRAAPARPVLHPRGGVRRLAVQAGLDGWLSLD